MIEGYEGTAAVVGGASFTPGPWTYRKASRGPSWYVEGTHTRAATPWIIADVDGMSEENEANAALIAAAPDLLAACEEMVAVLRPSSFATYSKMEAAIRKARGQNNDAPLPEQAKSESQSRSGS